MTQIISKGFVSRLLKDVKYIRKNPLHSSGIYYLHDEDDIMTGYALIIGPSETPYENGYYFFRFNFTPNYPHEPPTVLFMTNGGNIRFNPNLYINGKVCISLLNTWRGEQWTSCQSISTVLLTLCTLFTNDPLLNEPGVSKNDTYNISVYNSVIKYANYNIAIGDVIDVNSDMHTNKTKFFQLFSDVTKEHFKRNFNHNMEVIEKQIGKCKCKLKCKLTCDNFRLYSNMYNMEIRGNYSSLKQKLQNIYDSIE